MFGNSVLNLPRCSIKPFVTNFDKVLRLDEYKAFVDCQLPESRICSGAAPVARQQQLG
jgi:hypothetical protein